MHRAAAAILSLALALVFSAPAHGGPGATHPESESTAMPRSALPGMEHASEELTPARLSLLRRTDGAAVVRMEGIITPAVGERFAALLDRLAPGEPLVVELDSPGGYTSAGYVMIDRLMQERQAGRRVTTVVRAGDTCESMCVGLFMAGEARSAAPTATFMVHAPRGLRSGTVTLRSTGRMIERLVSLGASPGWIERVKQAGGFSGRLDYRTTAAELAADNANVVNALLP